MKLFLLLFLSLLFVFLLCFFLSRLARRRILHFGDRAEHLVALTLKKHFPKDTLWNDFYLKNGNGLTQIDHLLVTARGIFLIETKSHNGFIETSGERWKQFWQGKHIVFHSPVLQNEIHRKALARVLKKTFPNLDFPIRSLVVFTSPRVRFSRKPSGVVTIEELIPSVKALEKQSRPMEKSTLRALTGCIRKTAIRGRDAGKFHERKMKEWKHR